jgi:DNA-binding GntR family transcriptional regulator
VAHEDSGMTVTTMGGTKAGPLAELTSVLRQRLDRSMRASRLPKYLQVIRVLEEMVADGTLLPGQQLPSETAFAAATRVSLGTVQKALTQLNRDGLVSREPGRGTFVRRASAELRGLWHFRFIGGDGRVLPVFPRVTAIEAVQSAGPWSRFLDGRDGCICVTRSVDVDGQFRVLSKFYVRSATCGPLLDATPEQLEGVHLRDYVREHFGVETARVIEEVGCEVLPGAVAAEIDALDGSLGLVCRIRAYGYKDEPAYFHLLYVPPGAAPLEMRERKP